MLYNTSLRNKTIRRMFRYIFLFCLPFSFSHISCIQEVRCDGEPPLCPPGKACDGAGADKYCKQICSNGDSDCINPERCINRKNTLNPICVSCPDYKVEECNGKDDDCDGDIDNAKSSTPLCPGGKVCKSGVCVDNCDAGTSACSGGCVDLNTNANHCGQCGNLCPTNHLCENARCVCKPYCQGKSCGSDGCGAFCGACSEGQVCDSGSCKSQCSAEQKTCSGACVNTSTNTEHCGSCSNRCPTNNACQNGKCVCIRNCAGKSCGDDGCGGSCGSCQNGDICDVNTCKSKCSSDPGILLCGGNCVNTNTDANHCGKCSNACPTTNKCEGGQCTANPSCSKDSECLNFQVCLGNKCTEPWCKNGLVNCGTLEGCCTYAINALQNGYQFWSEVCVAQPQFYKCSDPIVGLPAIKAVCIELGCEDGTQGKIKGNCSGADAQKNFEKARGWIENAFQALDGFCKLYSHNNCGPRKQEVSDYFFKQLCQCSPRGC